MAGWPLGGGIVFWPSSKFDKIRPLSGIVIYFGLNLIKKNLKGCFWGDDSFGLGQHSFDTGSTEKKLNFSKKRNKISLRFLFRIKLFPFFALLYGILLGSFCANRCSL